MINGEEMPRRKEGRDWGKVIFFIFMFLLFLKGIGIIQYLFHVDPYGLTISIDVGALLAMTLFGLIYRNILDHERRITAMEITLQYIQDDLKQIKQDLQEIKNKLGIH